MLDRESYSGRMWHRLLGGNFWFLVGCNGLFEIEVRVRGDTQGEENACKDVFQLNNNQFRGKRIYRNGLSTSEHTMLQYNFGIKTNLFNDDGNVCYRVLPRREENSSPYFISILALGGMEGKRA